MRLYRRRRTHLGARRGHQGRRSDEAFDIDSAVFNPTRYYERPNDVLADERLEAPDKRRILESWALDAQRLSESDDENMTGRASERPLLREARLALLELER